MPPPEPPICNDDEPPLPAESSESHRKVTLREYIECDDSMFDEPQATPAAASSVKEFFFCDNEEEDCLIYEDQPKLAAEEDRVIEERYIFSQCGPFHALQPVSEDDPDYLLKLVTIEPPMRYIPSFLQQCSITDDLEKEEQLEDDEPSLLIEEMPFKEVDNMDAVQGMPFNFDKF